MYEKRKTNKKNEKPTVDMTDFLYFLFFFLNNNRIQIDECITTQSLISYNNSFWLSRPASKLKNAFVMNVYIVLLFFFITSKWFFLQKKKNLKCRHYREKKKKFFSYLFSFMYPKYIIFVLMSLEGTQKWIWQQQKKLVYTTNMIYW